MAQTYQGRFISAGDSIDHTPAGNVAAGAVVVVGSLVGIAKVAIAAAVLGALAVRGIFDVVQAAVAFTAGDAVYWDADGDPVGGTAGSGAATSSASGNTFMAFALADTADTDEKVRLALRSVESSAAESLSLSDLGDVGPVVYTAGRIIVADGDSFEDVPVSGDATLGGDGALTLTAPNLPANEVIADPGDAGAIPVTNSGSCPLVTTGAETRTLADPTYAGQLLNLCFKTDGGDCVVTAASPVNQTGNNTLTFTDEGENLLLIGCDDGADIEWRVVCNDGAVLSTA